MIQAAILIILSLGIGSQLMGKGAGLSEPYELDAYEICEIVEQGIWVETKQGDYCLEDK